MQLICFYWGEGILEPKTCCRYIIAIYTIQHGHNIHHHDYYVRVITYFGTMTNENDFSYTGHEGRRPCMYAFVATHAVSGWPDILLCRKVPAIRNLFCTAMWHIRKFSPEMQWCALNCVLQHFFGTTLNCWRTWCKAVHCMCAPSAAAVQLPPVCKGGAQCLHLHTEGA